MTSIGATYAQIPANKLYINIVAVQSTIVDSNNNLVPWAASGFATTNYSVLGLLSTPGAAVFRDMGRQVYIPNPTVPTSVGSQSTILRKVQLVTQGSLNGYYGTGNNTLCVPGSGTDYFTGYIRMGGQTYGGGTGVPTGVARLN